MAGWGSGDPAQQLIRVAVIVGQMLSARVIGPIVPATATLGWARKLWPRNGGEGGVCIRRGFPDIRLDRWVSGARHRPGDYRGPSPLHLPRPDGAIAVVPVGSGLAAVADFRSS